MKFLNERLKEAREGKKLNHDGTIIALENFGVKISRSTLWNWENGRGEPDGSVIVQIAKFFKKPVGYFFEKEDENG